MTTTGQEKRCHNVLGGEKRCVLPAGHSGPCDFHGLFSQATSAAANCDVCNQRPGVRSITAYGIETWACAECLGEEIDDESMDDATRYALGAM